MSYIGTYRALSNQLEQGTSIPARYQYTDHDNYRFFYRPLKRALIQATELLRSDIETYSLFDKVDLFRNKKYLVSEPTTDILNGELLILRLPFEKDQTIVVNNATILGCDYEPNMRGNKIVYITTNLPYPDSYYFGDSSSVDLIADEFRIITYTKSKGLTTLERYNPFCPKHKRESIEVAYSLVEGKDYSELLCHFESEFHQDLVTTQIAHLSNKELFKKDYI
jgi:hypothetical protein